MRARTIKDCPNETRETLHVNSGGATTVLPGGHKLFPTTTNTKEFDDLIFVGG